MRPRSLTALAVVEREGPLTLGELAAQEQVSPPTITKVVDALEAKGSSSASATRTTVASGACARPRAAAAQLEASRTRRTAWLATQLRDLGPRTATGSPPRSTSSSAHATPARTPR